MKRKKKNTKKSRGTKLLVWDSALGEFLDKSKKVSGYYIDKGRITILYEERV